MKTIRKKVFAFSGLFMVLAQVFIMAFCSIVAVAVTTDETQKTLFDTTNAIAKMAYEETGENRLKWTIGLEKKGSELPTKFDLQLLAESNGVKRPLIPENLQVVNQSDELVNLKVGDGETTTSIYEMEASTVGSVVLTFETARDFDKLLVTPHLKTTEANTVDLLADVTETVFELPVTEETTDSSPTTDYTTVDEPLSEGTEESTQLPVLSTEVEDSTLSSSQEVVETVTSSEEVDSSLTEEEPTISSTEEVTGPKQTVESQSSEEVTKDTAQPSKKLAQSRSLIAPTPFDSAKSMINVGDERDVFLYNGILTGNHSAIAADIEGAMFIFGDSVIPNVRVGTEEASFFYGGHFQNGTGSGGVGSPLTTRHRINLTLGGEFKVYSEGVGQIDGVPVGEDEKKTLHPGYLLTNETQATTGWLNKFNSGISPHKNIRIYGPAKYLPDNDFENLKSDVLAQQQKVYNLLDSKIANLNALEDKQEYGKYQNWLGFNGTLYRSADDPSVLIYNIDSRTDDTAVLPGFILTDSFIADDSIKQIIVYSEKEKIIAGHTDGIFNSKVAEKVVYYLPNAKQVTNFANNKNYQNNVSGMPAPTMPTKFNDDEVNQFDTAYFQDKRKIHVACSGFLIAPQATVAMTNGNWNGYLWAKNLYQEGGWELHNFYNPWVEEQVNFRFQLHKYSSSDEKIAIEGANFIFYRMKDGKREYLKSNTTVGAPVWTTNKDEAKEFYTDRSGNTAVTGIPEDASFTYYFEEIEPAPGYVMPDNPHFEVAMNSITQQPNLKEVPNTPEVSEKYTSLRFEKTWQGVPSNATDEQKTVYLQIQRKVKGSSDDTYKNYGGKIPFTYTGKAVDTMEWHNLPVGEDPGYEYIVTELPSQYYDVTNYEKEESAINSLTTVDEKSSTEWLTTNPSYFVSRNTNHKWVVWTAAHLSSNEERQAFGESIAAFTPDKTELHQHFKNITDYNGPDIYWIEGDVTQFQGISTKVQYNENDIQVTLTFDASSTWSQWMYGSHSTREVRVTNKFIPTTDITVQKIWEDGKYSGDTREDIKLILQQKIGTGAWTDYQEFEILKISEVFTKTYTAVPTEVKVEENGKITYKPATYRVIERVKSKSGTYTEDRVYGYDKPAPTEPAAGYYTVTNTLLKIPFGFTKVKEDGSTPFKDVTFTLQREGKNIGEPISSGTDGKVSFGELPVGNYTLTETQPKGYESSGPWSFEIVDNDGVLDFDWDGESPLDATNKLVNYLKLFDLKINKTDDLGNPLSGATFTLTGPDGATTSIDPEEGDSETATFTFKNLTPGTYILTETTPPSGYIGLKNPITVVISKTGEVTFDDIKVGDPLTDGATNNMISYTVANEPKVPLPATGGPGTMLFSLIGVLALLLSGGYFLLRRGQEADSVKKMFKFFALLVLVLPTLSLNGTKAEAAEIDVTFALHKIAFPEGEMPEEIANTGDYEGVHHELLMDYKGLNDVVFEAYDVTNQFYQMRNDGASVEEAQLALSQLEVEELGEVVDTQTTTTIFEEDGTALFNLPAVDKEGRDAAYLFHEAAAPETVTAPSKNLVVVLPVFNADEEQLSTIHLYPKNEEWIHEIPPFDKAVVDQAESYQFGDIINYELRTTVPHDVKKYTKFQVSDASDPGLVYQAGTLQVKAGDDMVTELYDLEESESGFTVKFTDFEAMYQHVGKELIFSYQTQLTEVKTETNLFKNQARLLTDFEDLTREVEVETGGKRFVKVDLEDKATLLAGAKFQVLNEQDQYLSKIAGGYIWTDDEDDENLVVLESDGFGQFEVNGLRFGDYSLQEIVAPEGYQLSTTPVSFTISKGSYTAGDPGILQVVNLKTPALPELPDTSGPEPTPTPTPETPATPTPTPATTTPQAVRPSLPKTNDVKNSSFIWVGTVLIAGVAIAFWRKSKNKKEEEE